MMTTDFQFEHDGRTYACRVEKTRAATPTSWWWIDVSGDRSRYAPFRAEKSDTVDSVKNRVVAYYDALLVTRAEPPRGWWTRGGNTKKTAAA